MRAWQRALGIGLVGGLLALAQAPGLAEGAEDLLSTFEDQARSPVELRTALASARDALAKSRHASAAGGLVVCSRDLPEGRTRRMARLTALTDRGIQALTAAGFAAPDLEKTPLLFVRVEVEEGLPLRLEVPAANAILERGVKRSRRTSLPVPPDRADGEPMIRDIVRATDQLRLHQWNTASSALRGRGSLPNLLARRLLASTDVPAAAPTWMREGLAAWLEERIVGTSDAPAAHICADAARATPDSLALLFEQDATTGARDVLVFGHVVEALLSGREDGPARLAAVLADASVLDAMVRAGIETLVPAEGPCDKDGGVACPVCDGDGNLLAACAACDGVGKMLCSACEGEVLCPARYCWRGKQRWPGDVSDVPCKYCNKKGDFKCLACGNKEAVKCKECRGRGNTPRACLACEGGRLPCAAAGVDDAVDRGRNAAVPCPWCAEEGAESACHNCFGIAYVGCETCSGSTRILCTVCEGHGKDFFEFRGYQVVSSYGKCDDCKGKGFFKCENCRSGKTRCEVCSAKGVEPYRKKDCAACSGTQVLPDAKGTFERHYRRVTVTQEKAKAYQAAKEKAVAFLLANARTSGGFALTYLRGSYKGRLAPSSLFSNAYILWALSAAGVPMDDTKTRAGWEALKRQMREVIDGKDEDPTTQSVALGLRALVMGGEEPDGALIVGAIELLTKHQRRNGFWNEDLFTEEDGDAYTSLYAVESLWIAHTHGAEVKSQIWRKAYGAANKSIRVGGPTDMRKKGSFITATRVASNTALVIMAKAGTLGKKAGTFDYRSIPAVKGGLAWLDRYFDIRTQPIFKSGARSRNVTDRGYGPYLFAIQRLGMLLNIADLGGERWYPGGADELLARQQEDGSIRETAKRPINDPVVMTTASLLFLVQATAPITGEK